VHRSTKIERTQQVERNQRLTPEYGAPIAVVDRATAPCGATEPADLPVQVPGPEIPLTLLALADEVIE
jgi:hypothetical protein